MATLTAHELRSQGHVTGPIALVSFASPRVGFGQFRDHFASQFPQGAWRVTRPDDVVTNVPPYVPFLWPWVHVPGEIYFSQQNGASRRCCDDASSEDGRCAASSNQILETGDQHLSFPYMVTGCAPALLHPHMMRLAQFYSLHAFAVTTWCLPGARASRCSAARTTASSRLDPTASQQVFRQNLLPFFLWSLAPQSRRRYTDDTKNTPLQPCCNRHVKRTVQRSCRREGGKARSNADLVKKLVKK